MAKEQPLQIPTVSLYDKSEYMSLAKAHQDEMILLLLNKDKKDLYNECNTRLCDIATCPIESRIYLFLQTYQKFLNSSLFNTISIINIISFKEYGYQQLFNDFLHLKLNHVNNNKLFLKYKLICQCNNIRTCHAFQRNFRDRSMNKIKQDSYYGVQNNSIVSLALSMSNNKDIIFQQECDKIHSFFLHSLSEFNDINIDYNNPDIDKLSKEISGNCNHREILKIRYIGEQDDKKWFNEYNTTQNDNYKSLINSQYMGLFESQNPHGFKYSEYKCLTHIKAKYNDTKSEVLFNKFHSLSTDNWNQTLRKSKTFNNSFARIRIRTYQTGIYDDQIARIKKEWKKGTEITLKEIVTLKLYTDFDKLKFTLNKCFLFNKYNDNRDVLEERLMSFFHWRSSLLIVLTKFARIIDHQNKILYHSVTSKKLFNLSATYSFYGPLSTSSSYHVAKTFATRKGMVLQITSQYPKLELCKAFDVSLISDYPEEKEWLLSFMYLRILQVRTRPIIAGNYNHSNNNSYYVPIESQIKEIFFVIHLFKSQIFSMSEHLENILIRFINKIDDDDVKLINININKKHISDIDNQKQKGILNILWIKFNEFRKQPNIQQVIKFDQMSDGLKKCFFDADTSTNIYSVISFDKITKIFPNVSEIHFLNEYKFDNHTLKKQLMQHLKLKKANNKLKRVKFLYYEQYDAKYQAPDINNSQFIVKQNDKRAGYQINMSLQSNLIQKEEQDSDDDIKNDYVQQNIKYRKIIKNLVTVQIEQKQKIQKQQKMNIQLIDDKCFLKKHLFNNIERFQKQITQLTLTNNMKDNQLRQLQLTHIDLGHNHGSLIRSYNQLQTDFFEMSDKVWKLQIEKEKDKEKIKELENKLNNKNNDNNNDCQ